MFFRVVLVLATVSTLSAAFSTTTSTTTTTIIPTISSSQKTFLRVEKSNDCSSSSSSSDPRRRNLMSASISLLGLIAGMSNSRAEDEPSKSTDGEGVVMYKTSSGLKYIELEPGRELDPSPRYGQICVISYKAYLKLPNSKEKQQFDSSGSYVMKHGSGRMIAGLDEGLHTMKPGGLRRIIIPPKLGFVQSGLGPLPRYPWDRRKLNSLLDQMVDQRGGNVVYDLRLEKIMDDEADQGYYEDVELSPEELEEIQNKLTKGRSNTQV